jgi:DNA-binding response OmpR family regulator
MPSKVLLIQDRAEWRALLTMTLQQQGYEVITCDTGATGLRAASTLNPDVICLDVSLPDISSIEVLTWLKANPSTRRIPVLVCVASVSRDLREEALRRGAAEILVTLQLADLLSALNRHLRQALNERGVPERSIDQQPRKTKVIPYSRRK